MQRSFDVMQPKRFTAFYTEIKSALKFSVKTQLAGCEDETHSKTGFKKKSGAPNRTGFNVSLQHLSVEFDQRVSVLPLFNHRLRTLLHQSVFEFELCHMQ